MAEKCSIFKLNAIILHMKHIPMSLSFLFVESFHEEIDICKISHASLSTLIPLNVWSGDGERIFVRIDF